MGSPTAQRALRAALVVSFYTVVAAAFLFHRGLFLGSTYLAGGTDPSAYVWFLKWWPYAMSHHRNPFLTHRIWAPSGFNLAWATSVPSLAVLAWPVTALWGPVVAFNVLTILAPILAASFAYLMCRQFGSKVIPALIGGMLFGFSSYEIGQLRGHLNLDFIAGVPLIVWLGTVRYQNMLRFWPFVLGMGTVLTFQLGVSSEIFATATFFGVIFFMLAYILVKDERSALGLLARDVGVAFGICLALSAPFLYYFFVGATSAPHLVQGLGSNVANLINYVVPTPIAAIGGAWGQPVSRFFIPNISEEGAYLGVPLLICVALFMRAFWGRPWSRALVALFTILVLCSLGPTLRLLGPTHIWLPWSLVQRLPLLDNAQPQRLMLYVSLIAALMVSLWLSRPRNQNAQMRAYALAGLAVIILLPNAHVALPVKSARLPLVFRKRFVFPYGVQRSRPTVVVLPYGYLGDSMLWQALSDMRFRMAGGYVGFTPQRFLLWPAVQMFYTKPLPDYRKQIGEFCAAHLVRAIIASKGTAPAWRRALRNLGWRSDVVGRATIYVVPTKVLATYHGATSTEASAPELENEVAALIRGARCYLRKGGALRRMVPRTLERMRCLSPVYGGSAIPAANDNWTRYNGWLGQFGQGIGVSVVVRNREQAADIITRYGLDAYKVYFPYPYKWKGLNAIAPDAHGQVMLVFKGLPSPGTYSEPTVRPAGSAPLGQRHGSAGGWPGQLESDAIVTKGTTKRSPRQQSDRWGPI